MRETEWSWRRDLNPRPEVYKDADPVNFSSRNSLFPSIVIYHAHCRAWKHTETHQFQNFQYTVRHTVLLEDDPTASSCDFYLFSFFIAKANRVFISNRCYPAITPVWRPNQSIWRNRSNTLVKFLVDKKCKQGQMKTTGTNRVEIQKPGSPSTSGLFERAVPDST
jgi:hypothetical protein